MGMKIEKSFVVQAPASRVWEFLTDPYQVARCLPGAAITEKVDDQSYTGTITVKVGPVTANYKGKMRFERLDAAAGEADLVASGQETRGKGGADMRMSSRVQERGPNETEVSVISDVNVMGALAQFGRGMIQDVSDQLFQKFTDAMRRELASSAPTPPEPVPVPSAKTAPEAPVPIPPAPAPQAAPPPVPPVNAPVPAGEAALDVGALGAQAARRAAVRMVSRPGFWIVVVLLGLLIYWVASR
jgi:carbon monoxide dehydrogenase subunit G